MDMKESERWTIPFNLGMTFWRLGDMRQRRMYLVRALVMIPEEETNTILRVNALINDECPMPPYDRLHPHLGKGLDDAADKMYEVLLRREDQTEQDRSYAAEHDSVGQSRAHDRGGGT